MVAMADKLSYDNRLTVRTHPEVLEGLNVLTARLQRMGVKFLNNRKVGLEGVAGAILLDFLRRGLDAQVALVVEVLPQLEAMIEGAGRADVVPEGNAGEGLKEVDPKTGLSHDTPGRRGKKKA